MTRCAFAKAFCADRSRFMRCCVAGFMPEDRPNSSRDAWSVIDAVRAVVLTKPAGNPKAAARSAGGSARRFVEDGGGGARGPCTAARNASSWSVSAAARSASFSAATARRRFFSFFRSFFRRFRFFSSLRSRLRFFSFLRFRLRLRSSLLEVLELELELMPMRSLLPLQRQASIHRRHAYVTRPRPSVWRHRTRWATRAIASRVTCSTRRMQTA